MNQNSIHLADKVDRIADINTQIDTESALSTLTKLQRYCFVEVRLNARKQEEVADELKKSRESVKQAISGAVKRLKNIFQDHIPKR